MDFEFAIHRNSITSYCISLIHSHGFASRDFKTKCSVGTVQIEYTACRMMLITRVCLVTGCGATRLPSGGNNENSDVFLRKCLCLLWRSGAWSRISTADSTDDIWYIFS